MKRLIALMISSAYWCMTLGGWLAGRKKSCVVLYYHGVTANAAKAFAEQMAWLADRFEVVRLSDVLRPRTRPAVCITFDDALENLLTNAIPLLTRLKLPVTIFAVSRNLANIPQWDMTPDHPESNERTMSEAQLRSLPHELIEVGSHTCTHPHLSRSSKEDVRRELCESKSDLESILGRQVLSFSAPYGEFHPTTIDEAREAGYNQFVTCDPYIVGSNDSPMMIGRFKTTPEDWPIEFRLKAAGAYAWRGWFRRRAIENTQLSDSTEGAIVPSSRQVRA